MSNFDTCFLWFRHYNIKNIFVEALLKITLTHNVADIRQLHLVDVLNRVKTVLATHNVHFGRQKMDVIDRFTSKIPSSGKYNSLSGSTQSITPFLFPVLASKCNTSHSKLGGFPNSNVKQPLAFRLIYDNFNSNYTCI